MAVVIEPHNPLWATLFTQTKENLSLLLKDVPITSIEHVGSTSVPDLPAKPVLDISIIVPAQHIPAARAAMSAGGYIDLGELGVPKRYVFRQPGFAVGDQATGKTLPEGEMRRNTYVVEEGCLSLRNHLDVKRVLIEDEGPLRREYGDVKIALAAKARDVNEYCEGKNEVVLKILRRAGWSEEEIREVQSANL